MDIQYLDRGPNSLKKLITELNYVLFLELFCSSIINVNMLPRIMNPSQQFDLDIFNRYFIKVDQIIKYLYDVSLRKELKLETLKLI